jgi:uncharacterized membrane-anchored protein
MQTRHVPTINGRYWAGIALASVFGTNMGDLFAHDSGLGLLGGLPILALLFLVVYGVERFDRHSHDAYYWLCITILRTGATNIADYMAGRSYLHIDRIVLSVAFALLLAVLVWWLGRSNRGSEPSSKTVPTTDPGYWITMLTAGVFGTIAGDLFQKLIGEDAATLGLAVIFGAVLFAYRKLSVSALAAYWFVVAVARTAGTAVGDWLAESPHLDLGLPLATAITGATLAAVLALWPRQKAAAPAA